MSITITEDKEQKVQETDKKKIIVVTGGTRHIREQIIKEMTNSDYVHVHVDGLPTLSEDLIKSITWVDADDYEEKLLTSNLPELIKMEENLQKRMKHSWHKENKEIQRLQSKQRASSRKKRKK